MAFLFQQPKSRYWWLTERTPSNLKRKSLKPLRWDSHADTRKARELCAEASLREIQGGAFRGENWLWLSDWLAMRYRDSPKTLERYATAWRSLSVFLEERQLSAPRQFTYQHAHEYLKWRQNPPGGLYRCSLNNAIYELKILGTCFREAIRRGLAAANPLTAMGIRKTPPAEKPAITDEQIRLIRAALLDEPEWMRVAFEIGLGQGCRLRETSIPLANFDLDLLRVTLDTVKGNRPFTTRLNRNLIPLIESLRSRRLERTCVLPPMPSKAWWLFFRRLRKSPLKVHQCFKKSHLCFHCTRVTAITWMARDGVSQAQAMRFVNHASATVHRIYQRLAVEDLSSAAASLERHGSPLP